MAAAAPTASAGLTALGVCPPKPYHWLLLSAAIFVLYLTVLHPWLMNWGTTGEERARAWDHGGVAHRQQRGALLRAAPAANVATGLFGSPLHYDEKDKAIGVKASVGTARNWQRMCWISFSVSGKPTSWPPAPRPRPTGSCFLKCEA